ncbi:MAG: hypothetical protein WAV54_15190 [Acidimicrobiales bacterium]
MPAVVNRPSKLKQRLVGVRSCDLLACFRAPECDHGVVRVREFLSSRVGDAERTEALRPLVEVRTLYIEELEMVDAGVVW